MKKLFFVLSAIALMGLTFFSCSSEEYTTAKLAIQQQDWEKAEEYLIKAMGVEPDNPEIPFQLGEKIYARKKEWAKMNDMFEKALAIDPDKTILQGHSVADYVENTRNKFWVEVYNEAVNTYKNVGSAFDDVEREELLQAALEKFQNGAAIDPTVSQTYASIATVYLDMQQFEDAKQAISQAVDIDPENPKVLIVAGQIFSRHGDCNVAADYLKRAVDAEPNNTAAIRALASTYYDCDDLDGAIITYESAISKETDTSIKCDLYFNLGVLYNQDDNFALAELNFQQVMDLCPDDSEALIGIAIAYRNAEKWRQAERVYRELIAIESDNPDHYKGLAVCLYQQGEMEDAEYYLGKADEVGN